MSSLKTIAYIWDRERQGADFSIRSSSQAAIGQVMVSRLLHTAGRYLMIVWMQDTAEPFSGWVTDDIAQVYGAIRALIASSSSSCRELTIERYVSAEVQAAIVAILRDRDAGVARFLNVDPNAPANK